MAPWQIFIINLCKYLAWPLVALLCIFTFKDDLRELLSRLRSLPGGTKLNPAIKEKQEESKKEFDTLFNRMTKKVVKNKQKGKRNA